ncbi:MAG: GMC family oxidoreductase [Candidatus Dadabacteria bacterium]|nr:MAG: GMC family oxidoreductase [Candidatus Dadabacteria bacterium]
MIRFSALSDRITVGTTQTTDLDITTQDCIIGSGCGGATLALRLAEAGRDVVILEQGGLHTAESGDLDQREDDMLAKIDGGRGLHASEDLTINFTYGRTVGGASVHYWADSYRTPADRLDMWAEEFRIEHHSLAELEPHFARIERDLHIEPAPDHLLNPLNRRLEQATETLGWHGHRVPQARSGCIGSGYCMQGCAYDAKQSQLVTSVPRALELGAHLICDARATTLVRNGKRITAVEGNLLDRGSGRTRARFRIGAERVFVAAGGFQTAPLLLRNGFGEELPALGARLYCNPCVMAHGFFAEPVDQFRGIPAGWGIDQFRLHRYDDNGAYIEGGYLLMPNQLQAGTLAAVLPGIGGDHQTLMARFRHFGGAIAWIDDLDPGRIEWDRNGRIRWHFSIGPRDRLVCRDAMRKGAQWLLAAGAEEVHLGDRARTVVRTPAELDVIDRFDFGPTDVVLAGPHPAGAAPMGRDPRTAVVDSEHRVFGTDNLYIADPSVFPTAVSVDPSVTIMAFSHRLADLLSS